MEKEFVPYPLALRLKALGFDEPCFGIYYTKDGHIRIITENEKGDAPTFSQAFLFVMQFPQIKKYRYNVALYSDGTYSLKEGKDTLYEYLSAESCLDKLLEIV